MFGMGGGDCPFAFNFDETTFKPGDTVSYRVTGSLDGMPFVGTLVEVHDDHVVIAADPNDPAVRYRGTRESRPVVAESEI
jgi:plastocyanin